MSDQLLLAFQRHALALSGALQQGCHCFGTFHDAWIFWQVLSAVFPIIPLLETNNGTDPSPMTYDIKVMQANDDYNNMCI
jgi:hypothetical protein